MKTKNKQFKLLYTIKRDEFYRLKKLESEKQKIEYNKIRKHLFVKAAIKVSKLENKNFLTKWWNNYYELNNLVNNYSYLDIVVEFWEDPKDSLCRVATGVVMQNMKREGLIK